MAEDAWNSRDPSRVALAYTSDSRWRNRNEFLEGRSAIEAFLAAQMAARTRLPADQGGLGLRERTASRCASPTSGTTTGASGFAPTATRTGSSTPRGSWRLRIASINDLVISEAERNIAGRSVDAPTITRRSVSSGRSFLPRRPSVVRGRDPWRRSKSSVWKTALDAIKRELSDIIRGVPGGGVRAPEEYKRFQRFFELAAEALRLRRGAERALPLSSRSACSRGARSRPRRASSGAVTSEPTAELGLSANDLEITLFETPRPIRGIRGFPGW